MAAFILENQSAARWVLFPYKEMKVVNVGHHQSARGNEEEKEERERDVKEYTMGQQEMLCVCV